MFYQTCCPIYQTFRTIIAFGSKHQTNCAPIRPIIHLDAKLAEKLGKNTDLIKILGG